MRGKITFSFIFALSFLLHLNAQTTELFSFTTASTADAGGYGIGIFSLNPADTVFIDWGDGNLTKHKMAGTIYAKNPAKLTGTAGQVIKVYYDDTPLVADLDPKIAVKLNGGEPIIVMGQTVSVDRELTSFASSSSLIEVVEIGGNKLSTVTVSGMAGLKTLNINSNTVALNTTVSDCPILNALLIANSQLADLTLSSTPALKKLDIADATISDLSFLTDSPILLNELVIKGLSVTDIDLSTQTELTYLDGTDLAITTLSLAQCPKLKFLKWEKGKLSTLDLSACPLLSQIYIKDGVLESINLHADANTVITNINVGGNKFTPLTLPRLSTTDGKVFAYTEQKPFVIEVEADGKTIDLSQYLYITGLALDGTIRQNDETAFVWYGKKDNGAFSEIEPTTTGDGKFTFVTSGTNYYVYCISWPAFYDYDSSFESMVMDMQDPIITGIDETKEENLVVYPNPFADKVTVVGHIGASVKILDMTGKVLFEDKLNSDNQTLHLDFLAKGVYLLQVADAERMSTLKILKK